MSCGTCGACSRAFSGFLWASVRAFLVPDDVLHMRTRAVKWNTAGLYGPSCRALLLPHEER